MATATSQNVVTQSAWCKWIVQDGIRIQPCDSIQEVSHGICINCMAEVEAAYCSDDSDI